MDEKNELESSKYEGVHEHIDEMLDDKKIKRKVDRWILPAMFMAYFLEFLDKVALNVCLRLPLVLAQQLIRAVCKYYGTGGGLGNVGE